MVWCPRCISFGEDCSVDAEDFDKPCSYYKEREPETVPLLPQDEEKGVNK